MSVDSYMNLQVSVCSGLDCSGVLASLLWHPILVYNRYLIMQLASTEEYIDGQFTGNLGEVLIR